MELLEWLKINWIILIASTGISWAGVLWIPRKIMELKYSKMLEKYKVDLQDISESTKFQYQRKLADFNLYTIKKHQNYIILYESMLKAEGHTFNLHGLQIRTDYSWCNKEDINEVLQDLKLPKGKSSLILSLWDSDKKAAITEIHKCISVKQEHDAAEELRLFKNLFWENQLYLSSGISDNVNKYLEELNTLYFNSEKEYIDSLSGEERAKNREDIKKRKENIQRLFTVIVDKMKEELSIGYYKVD